MPYEKEYLIKRGEMNIRFTDKTHKITSHIKLDDLADFSQLKKCIIKKLKKIAEERNLGSDYERKNSTNENFRSQLY